MGHHLNGNGCSGNAGQQYYYQTSRQFNSIANFQQQFVCSAGQIKRRRTSFTQFQLNVLEDAFRQNIYPSSTFRDILASQTQLDSSRIQVWFQNRRAMRKKQVGNDLILHFPACNRKLPINLDGPSPQTRTASGSSAAARDQRTQFGGALNLHLSNQQQLAASQSLAGDNSRLAQEIYLSSEAAAGQDLSSFLGAGQQNSQLQFGGTAAAASPINLETINSDSFFYAPGGVQQWPLNCSANASLDTLPPQQQQGSSCFAARRTC